jgi:UDP-N-acetyl-D-glucosamine dehydrogenase
MKIDERSAIVGVVGLGYVGLPLAVELAKTGFKTIGFDINSQRVDMVNEGRNYIGDVDGEDLAALVKNGALRATGDFSCAKHADFIAICVPTPLDSHQQPDISHVRESAKSVAPFVKRGGAVVLESTTYPGTTEELVKPILEEGSGLKCGEGFYLGFSPERVDPGNPVYKTGNTPKVVGAVGRDALAVIAHMYRSGLGCGVFETSGPAVAEMEKILENTYRNVNIGLINEVAILCDKIGIDVWEVIEAAKTKPYGFQPFYPGPGPGGHCIPLDPNYLTWKAREYGFHTSMIEASAIINDRMPEYCASRAVRILNSGKKALNGSKALVLGVAYKQDVDDCRESPALALIHILSANGCEVSYYDPYVPKCSYKGKEMESLERLTPGIVKDFDLVVIAVAHTNVDYEMAASVGVPVLDLKNAAKNVKNRVNIETL